MGQGLAPPGEVTEVRAARTLVIAPHFDDELFGCGGLIAKLVDGGGRVEVLHLSDSAGGVEVDGGDTYAERRRLEAERGLTVLGVTDFHAAGLPDGRLELYLDEAAAAIRARLLATPFDLVLAPSPLEVSTDHRAAFAALHRVLAPLRGGTPLDQAVAELRILLYEVNHPAYPDLLVDVSDVIDRLDRAIDQHQSQLALHNYREAALGLRRHRTLSLPSTVTAAEGYRVLGVDDFRTRSLSGLVRAVGGVAELLPVADGPRVSVVVRTRNRPRLLAEALTSLAAGSYRAVEVVVINDGGEPPTIDEAYPLAVVRVDLPTNRGRAAAANAGIAAATGDWVAFLDDDDLAEPEHLATLVGLATGSGSRVVYTDAAVGVYEPAAEGWLQVERRLPYSRDFDPELLHLDNYIPFNTLLIDRTLLPEVGPLDESLPFFEDWELLLRLATRTPFLHLPQVTCEYRHFRAAGHHVFGERPAARADFLEVKARVIARHLPADGGAELLSRVVDRLRAETVGEHEAAVSAARDATAARRELDGLRGDHLVLTDAYHRLNGEREALRSERERMINELAAAGARLEGLQGLTAELERHRTVVADQDAHLGRLYAEIERLGGVIRDMESTRAWRLHRRLESLRGRSR